MDLTKKREAAIAYLKQRGKYVLDGSFSPTPARSTDVKKTIHDAIKTLNPLKRISSVK